MTSAPLPLTRPEFLPLSIARMLWKRKLIIVLIWAVVIAVAAHFIFKIPSVYRAEALILVDSQKIPDRFVASTVNVSAQDRLATITQQILSSSRLQKLIEEIDHDAPGGKQQFREDMLAVFRSNLHIAVEKGWSGDRLGAFRVAYEGSDRVKVAEVANRVANLFIEENLKTRELQATGTSEFIDSQLQEAKRKLDELETSLSHYKVVHNGELPEQQNALVAAMTRLHTQFEANRDAIAREEQSIVMLNSTLTTLETAASTRANIQQAARAVAATPAPVYESVRPAAVVAPKPSDDIRQQLAELRLRYSDEHPAVRRLQLTLNRMLEQEASAAKAEAARAETAVNVPKLNGEDEKVVHAAKVVATATPDPESAQLRERIAAVKSQIALARTEVQKRKQEQERVLQGLSSYQNRIDRLPIREQEMAKVTRDYEISKGNYQSLLASKISADMASDMERRQKSERFTLAEPAAVPMFPYKPDRKKMLATACMFGLGFGLLFAFVIEVRKDTILGDWELPPNVVVLGTLPSISISAVEKQPGLWRRLRDRKHTFRVRDASALGLIAAAYTVLREMGRM